MNESRKLTALVVACALVLLRELRARPAPQPEAAARATSRRAAPSSSALDAARSSSPLDAVVFIAVGASARGPMPKLAVEARALSARRRARPRPARALA